MNEEYYRLAAKVSGVLGGGMGSAMADLCGGCRIWIIGTISGLSG